MPCPDCGSPDTHYTKKGRSGFCRKCYRRRHAAGTLPGPRCIECGKQYERGRGRRLTTGACPDCRRDRERRLAREWVRHLEGEALAEYRRKGDEAQRRWKQTPRGRLLSYAANYRRATGIKITWDEIAELMERQGNRCPICDAEIAYVPGHGSLRNPHLDHEPGTKNLRGWLCGPCNRGLGCLGDDPERLERAAAYIRSGGPAQAAA